MHTGFRKLCLELAPRHERAIVLGATGSWAFACGVLCLQLLRGSPPVDADIIVLHDTVFSSRDRACLTQLGVQCLCFDCLDAFRKELLTETCASIFSLLSLAKFACFDFLHRYTKLLWLDCDIVVQESFDDIWAYGPLALSEEDDHFYDHPAAKTCAINFEGSFPGIDVSQPNLNSGVLVFDRMIPDWEERSAACLAFVREHKKRLRYPDQAVFTMLAQAMAYQDNPRMHLPNRFNCHPRNPQSLYATFVHCFGPYKVWNDGLMLASYPEWQRVYKAWLSMGGSPYQGKMENSEYGQKNIFAVLRHFFALYENGEKALATMHKELVKERKLRTHWERIAKILLEKKNGVDAEGKNHAE
ncbi:MAG: glycosyl transferase family 8 [Desulfovibrio sp.]|nr:glycosyl transferase family 8 [Desulfovibrio sp.]